jgi:hypothetical protein
MLGAPGGVVKETIGRGRDMMVDCTAWSGRPGEEWNVEQTWHDGLSRTALVELVEALLLSMDKAVPRLDAIAHHLSLIAQHDGDHEVIGGVSDQVADISDELYAASDRDKLREWGNEIDAPEKAH